MDSGAAGKDIVSCSAEQKRAARPCHLFRVDHDNNNDDDDKSDKHWGETKGNNQLQRGAISHQPVCQREHFQVPLSRAERSHTTRLTDSSPLNTREHRLPHHVSTRRGQDRMRLKKIFTFLLEKIVPFCLCVGVAIMSLSLVH